MTAEVEVYNLALARIGVFNKAVASTTEASKEAQICKLFFNPMRDYVLEEIHWRFAEKRVALADLGTPPTNWGYRYSYPADCIKANYLTLPGLRNTRLDQRPPFQISGDGNAKFILTDLPTAELVYTCRVEDLGLWPAMAISALAYRLAAEIAMPLSIKADVANNAMSAYYREVSRAEASMLNEGTPDPAPTNEFTAIRGYQGPWPPDGSFSSVLG